MYLLSPFLPLFGGTFLSSVLCSKSEVQNLLGEGVRWSPHALTTVISQSSRNRGELLCPLFPHCRSLTIFGTYTEYLVLCVLYIYVNKKYLGCKLLPMLHNYCVQLQVYDSGSVLSLSHTFSFIFNHKKSRLIFILVAYFFAHFSFSFYNPVLFHNILGTRTKSQGVPEDGNPLVTRYFIKLSDI